VRWALNARVLLLRSGVLRVAKQNASLLDEPEVLWFRAFAALQSPDTAFTDLLGDYGGVRIWWSEPVRAVSNLLRCLAADALDDDALMRAYTSRYPQHLGPMADEVRVLAFLAEALGLIGRDEPAVPASGPASGPGSSRLTALGRVVVALYVLPFTEVAAEDEELAAVCLLGQPDSQIEPGFQVKVSLPRYKVWRRLVVPGELTMHGLHLAIQSAFGWGNGHLHLFKAGPFRFSSASGWHRLDHAIPTDYPPCPI
jgi:hypothetical protein